MSLWTLDLLFCAQVLKGSVKLGPVKDLFEFGESTEGCPGHSPLLTLTDESTKVPGLFLVGPSVQHGKLSFCFVYKFRQRFGIVADVIARGLGHDTSEAVARCREMDMFMDDFNGCKEGLR